MNAVHRNRNAFVHALDVSEPLRETAVLADSNAFFESKAHPLLADRRDKWQSGVTELLA